MYTITDLLKLPKEKFTPSERGELMVATRAARHWAKNTKWLPIAQHIAYPDDYPLPESSALKGTITLRRLSDLIDTLYDKYSSEGEQA